MLYNVCHRALLDLYQDSYCCTGGRRSPRLQLWVTSLGICMRRWPPPARTHCARWTRASSSSAFCPSNVIHRQAIVANATRRSLLSNAAMPLPQMHAMRLCCTIQNRQGRHASRPTLACRRSLKSSTSPALHDLDVTLVLDCELVDILAKHSLVVQHTISIEPANFLAQRLLPSIAGIYVCGGSAPLAAAHRRVGAGTQSRIEIPPGSCLLRGERSRHEWTLAIPPLLGSMARRGGHSTRVVTILAEAHDGEDAELSLAFDVHQPRPVLPDY